MVGVEGNFLEKTRPKSIGPKTKIAKRTIKKAPKPMEKNLATTGTPTKKQETSPLCNDKNAA
jgi:hypothetical protein